MENTDFITLVVILLAIFGLFYKLVPIFIGFHLESDNYAIRDDFCKNDEDCYFINSNCDSCSCNFKAVNKEYYDHWGSDLCSPDVHCDTYCEMPLSNKCINNKCTLEW